VPAPKTEITEIVTGLALLGGDDLDEALHAPPPPQLRNVAPEVWCRLSDLRRAGRHRQEFAAAWANGRAFFTSAEGLGGRVPRVVEWKGPTRAPGDEVVPADLRVDHVYLVSCKYLSRVLANASPQRLFDRNLAGGPDSGADGIDRTVATGDWYAHVAPAEYQALYEIVRTEVGTRADRLPPLATDLTPRHRADLRAELARWSTEAQRAYRELAAAVGRASSARWKASLRRRRDQEAVLWRLLRIGSAPYFVLGASRERTLRLRIMTPWDWRQAFELRRVDVWGDDAGQPQVRWQAIVRDRQADGELAIDGHVEIRWSHGRFGRPPEAKVYLDTPHHRVPGYVELT
jgi:hypothetical protein